MKVLVWENKAFLLKQYIWLKDSLHFTLLGNKMNAMNDSLSIYLKFAVCKNNGILQMCTILWIIPQEFNCIELSFRIDGQTYIKIQWNYWLCFQLK